MVIIRALARPPKSNSRIDLEPLYFRRFLLDQTLQFGWVELGSLAEPHRFFAGGRMDDRADEIIALARIQSGVEMSWIACLAKTIEHAGTICDLCPERAARALIGVRKMGRRATRLDP
jgi:hypothetical protein